MHELTLRAAAASAALSRYRGRPLDWGRVDCVRMLAFTLRTLKQPASLAKAGSYYSATGALKALKRTGHDSLEAAIDAQGLIRISPAAARVADALAVPGDGALSAIWIVLGNGKALGWHEDSDLCSVISLQPGAAIAAWSTYRG